MPIQNKMNNFFQEYSADTFEISPNYKNDLGMDVFYVIKRIIDIILSSLGIIITLPAIVFFALLIKIETPGPAFFFQKRVGLNGRYFNIVKLRSMDLNAEINGAKWAEQNDPRITKIGAFIRKTRIDEIPQLINVLKGEMTLIGPRPERPMFTAEFNKEIPEFTSRLAVKPGITGWAQVHGGYNITPSEKLELDLYYIKNMNLAKDITIIFKTLKVVITGDGAR